MKRYAHLLVGKPPYRVPLISELNELPWNGFRVASTFAGGGGSSLGYRLAGFRVVYASEFIPLARETYEANRREWTFVDGRDIREVSAESLLEHAGVGRGELDILDGSPPCASFSTAGKREKAWGTVKKYSDSEQRSDDLFYEFARLVAGVQPKVFVAENVSGLIKGTAKGYFLRILERLREAGYRVEAQLLDAQWLGVPQVRQRLIFVGVRNDLGLAPAFPAPLPYRYTVRDAIPGIAAVATQSGAASADSPVPFPVMSHNRPGTRSELSALVEPEADISRFAIGAEWDKIRPGEQSERYFSLVKPHPDAPSPTVTASAGMSSLAGVVHPYVKRKFSIAELRRLCAFPDDYEVRGTYAQQWERLGRAVPPVMMSHVAAAVRDKILGAER
jgi:DNA (cytosine-5)-methyltransferase 1